MTELFAWISEALTDMQTAGQIATVIFFLTFCGILIYVFTGKHRKKRFDSYRYIPLDDEDAETGKEKSSEEERKGSADDGQQ
ncbi:hypothetical protein AN478_02180 [Thiohalorhabdus denitrificans]|uniref:Cbb3-type cytochrome oxidase, subunit 3 n=1 Tax=Thiohalorhabdus denitrificans TaxID=381306 RepID=A0A0P9C845_9GAMM|nr:cbb3-type cytochrome c oxidase subunit 3 [Thiohalorhabdus denitrificans]KPV41406.1 hypothetical protein AN478_02180 [Thiohalorhabdus denitrificans]SCY26241.1 Cbb3-type cytochrome oxidase, subunit 3 [Thiohalorhabdus denitrificans]